MPPEAVSDDVLISLLQFWSEAGVDCCLEDAPVNRRVGLALLAAPQARSQPLGGAPAVRTGFATSDVSGAVAMAQAHANANACDSLEELEAAIRDFKLCPLSAMGARQAVFSRGLPDAQVVIIGEGPGAEEDLQGAPFVGRAGRLLDRMLAAAGLIDKTFITNTVFWRPPGNRTPTPEEQAICAPFVTRAVQLVDPDVVLLLGGAAANSVLQRPEGILSLRGKWAEWAPSAFRPLPTMPSLHPAFLLRQPAAKKMAWADLLSLKSRLEPRT